MTEEKLNVLINNYMTKLGFNVKEEKSKKVVDEFYHVMTSINHFIEEQNISR